MVVQQRGESLKRTLKRLAGLPAKVAQKVQGQVQRHWFDRLSPGNRLLLEIAGVNWPWIIGTIILNFLSGLFNGVSVALLVPAIMAFFGKGTDFGNAPGVVQKLLNLFDRVPGTNRVGVAVAAIVAAIVLKNVLSFIGTAVGGHLSRSLVNGATFRALKLLLEVGIDYYSKMKTGEIVQRIGSEMSGAVGTINTIVQITATLLTMSTFVALLISISWQLTIVAGLFSIAIVFANRFFSKTAKELGYRGVVYNREYTSALVEMIAGIRLIKASSTENLEYDRLSETILKKQRNDLQTQSLSAFAGSTNELLSVLSLLAIVAVGWWLFADRESLYIAILLTYLFLLSRVLGFVTTLGKALNNLYLCTAAVNGMVNFLDRHRKHFVPNGTQTFTGLRESVRFENVSFHYPGHDRQPVLSDVSFEIPKGKTLAIVGSSGSGKSTLADLLVRFYDPTAGRILLDGQDLRDFDLATVHQRMGVVSQATFLFNETVYNNIAYGCADATLEQVTRAASLANALEFIEKLPQKFNTPLGDRGVRLSGGQQQRLAIARALLRDPDILVLDEATSALDTSSERLVQAAIDELSRHRTVLVIAHRLSTVQNAHCILALENGRVVEMGTHQELLAVGGRYAQLYGMQFSDQAEDHPVGCENVLEPIVAREAKIQLAARAHSSGEMKLDPSDVTAYVLNRLPPLYATTRSGAQFQHTKALEEWNQDIADHVAEAIVSLRARPDLLQDRLTHLEGGSRGSQTWGKTVVRRLSYDVRSRLNVLLGAIDLLDDEDVETIADYRNTYYQKTATYTDFSQTKASRLQGQYEAAKEAYVSAMHILGVLDLLETTLLAGEQSHTLPGSSVTADRVRDLALEVEQLARSIEVLSQRLLDALLAEKTTEDVLLSNPLYGDIRQCSQRLLEAMTAIELTYPTGSQASIVS